MLFPMKDGGRHQSSFLHRIMDVVGIGAQKQMGGVDTVTDIAFVQNVTTWGDRAIGQLPGDAVGPIELPPNANCSIPIPDFGSLP